MAYGELSLSVKEAVFVSSMSARFDCGSLLCYCEFVSLKSGTFVVSEFVCGLGVSQQKMD